MQMNPGVATGIGSITEQEIIDFDQDDDSLKDISTARRKRKLTFQNESSADETSNDSLYSTVIVRKRKRKNKNGTESSESSGIQLC